MQITDEMIEAAKFACFDKHGLMTTDERIKTALTAAYPLIRDQVLEEAAQCCEDFPKGMDELYLFATGYKAKAESIAKAIRNMKGNKDA